MQLVFTVNSSLQMNLLHRFRKHQPYQGSQSAPPRSQESVQKPQNSGKSNIYHLLKVTRCLDSDSQIIFSARKWLSPSQR
jgi:hypothetical protein